jgi:dTDP-L-rhamnose 4-epimerase
VPKRILVTGGAGFIGSHLVDALVAQGHQVRLLDNLDPQVHGPQQRQPEYLNPEAEFLQGDVRNPDDVAKALADIEVLFHQAAAVGVGQSMYQVRHYVEVNALGAANILELVANGRTSLEKMVVASSMSIYGEGRYRCPEHGLLAPRPRPREQLASRQWEPFCPVCGTPLEKAPCDEAKPLQPTSIYAITKRDHEEMFLTTGFAYRVPAVALRYFNVYGTRQALSNPYTGVAAIFSGRLLNGRAPVIYEDGQQTRDFIHVSDIVAANLRAMERSEADFQAVNVGTGQSVSIGAMARLLQEHICPEKPLAATITHQFREGDIRHCYAEVQKARELLGFEAKVPFEQGLVELTSWVRQQQAEDRFEEARQELTSRGLTSEDR